MGEAEEFRKALISIAKKVKQKLEMTEGDVYSCFVDEGFFRALDYGVGIDARAQERIGAQYADYDCVDDIEQSIFILEAKKPAEEDLLAYRDRQLKEKYVLPKSDAVIKKILQRLEEDKAGLREKPIAELEKEINERGYKLYGLTEDEIKIVEGAT